MLMCGFTAPHWDEKAKRLVDELYIGNFVLFSRNITNYENTSKLCGEINAYSSIRLDKKPFISIDEECGMVRRLYGISTHFPGNLAVAAIDSETACQALGERLGKELADLGINMDFAPSLDVNVNPDNPVIGMRSYGDSPERVARLGLAMGKGLKESGVIPVFKHFPGHGDTAVDSHFGIPLINHSMDRLNEIELYPFKEAIKQNADCIMVSHLLFEAIDPEHPATLSRKVVHDFLKTELGFDGITVTDCLEMEAITKSYGIGEAAVRAIEAGIDIVLVSHTYEAQKTCVEAIYQAVESGRISMDAIENSVSKIDRYKQKLNRTGFAADINKTEHLEFAGRLYRQSVTLAAGELPPIDAQHFICLGVEAFQGTPAEDFPKPSLNFASTVSTRLHLDAVSFCNQPDDALIDHLVLLASQKNGMILGLADAHRFKSQRKLYERLLALGKSIVVVSLRMPYDLMGLPAPQTHLCSYEYTPMAIEAVCDALKRQIKPGGALPLKIS